MALVLPARLPCHLHPFHRAPASYHHHLPPDLRAWLVQREPQVPEPGVRHHQPVRLARVSTNLNSSSLPHLLKGGNTLAHEYDPFVNEYDHQGYPGDDYSPQRSQRRKDNG